MREVAQQLVLRFDFVNQANTAIDQHTLLNIFDFDESGPRSPKERNRSHTDFNRICTSTCVCELTTVIHCTRTRLPERLLKRSIAFKQKGGWPPYDRERRDRPNITSAAALACATSPFWFSNRTVVASRSKASTEFMGIRPGGPTPSFVGSLEAVVKIKLNRVRRHAQTVDFVASSIQHMHQASRL
jgi:hypothetical protein